MGGSFLDTSALAKLYHAEIGTPFIENLLLRPDRVAFISRLCVLELQSVLAGKVRSREITESEMDGARRRFRSDVRKRRFHVVAVGPRHFLRAEALIRQHGASHGLRTLDALQLAVASDLHQNHLIDDFLAADKILCQVAAMEGLATIDPETAPV